MFHVFDLVREIVDLGGYLVGEVHLESLCWLLNWDWNLNLSGCVLTLEEDLDSDGLALRLTSMGCIKSSIQRVKAGLDLLGGLWVSKESCKALFTPQR